ncbi:hypothetical protein FRC91_00850 [Bradymonadales bacterium TMQ1]|uniref:Outer membrane protein beta-barrel domain-containing protein n=1 Tax=Lujinxingia sediminis TaxID=2480984 RepID=A0ABY0CWF2_9DELT|nr:hypothetical protein [Lujinxingia sediminis]RVU48013.1 hypothetical protein EA187_00845 [Lujinxingia sediminis]TXC77312.1 hypothetical protein FRC91_00850 [Bradymonadales bacterium TMQ1]
MSAWKRRVVSLWSALSVLTLAAPAMAGSNDLELSRFATFNDTTSASGCTETCGFAEPDDQLFYDLSRDLGQVMAPRFVAPSETLGQAGFAVMFMGSLSAIPHNEAHWQEGVRDRNPESTLFTGHLQVRKGLPFSFEVAGNLGYLYDSEMFTMGADVRWALNEGFYYFPDVGVRGTVNTVVGARELNMVNVGWDVSASKSFALGGVMALTPYVGFQQLYVISSSRVLNAYPQDPRPPQFNPDSPNQVFAPEFVFGQEQIQINRFLGGLRMHVWILNFTLEAVFSDTVQQYTFAGGVDF